MAINFPDNLPLLSQSVIQDPANLDKLPPRELAIKTLEYMGGINNVLKKTKIDFEKGEYRWVVYILDQILWAYPDNTEAKELAALTHTQLGFSSENATWRNAYLSAAQELREGIPSEGKNHRILRDVLKGMSPILLLNSLSIRINGPKAENKFFTINWKIKNSNIACHSELTNCVLVNREGIHNKAEVTVKITKDKLSQFALGEMKLLIYFQNGFQQQPTQKKLMKIKRQYSSLDPKPFSKTQDLKHLTLHFHLSKDQILEEKTY